MSTAESPATTDRQDRQDRQDQRGQQARKARSAKAPTGKVASMARDSVRTVIAASMVGTAIEFYDFYAYGTAAANYFPKVFFGHSVANSPWRRGGGNLVAVVSRAAARHGLRFGIYLSPWDRTEATYGSGVSYDDFYVNQLIELLTHYGPIFCIWLDGACGEGPNDNRQVYDWNRYYQVIRALQPDAVINVCGPDVRWCWCWCRWDCWRCRPGNGWGAGFASDRSGPRSCRRR